MAGLGMTNTGLMNTKGQDKASSTSSFDCLCLRAFLKALNFILWFSYCLTTVRQYLRPTRYKILGKYSTLSFSASWPLFGEGPSTNLVVQGRKLKTGMAESLARGHRAGRVIHECQQSSSQSKLLTLYQHNQRYFRFSWHTGLLNL